MLHIDLTLEDTRLVLTNTSQQQGGPWIGTISDSMTGKEASVAWTDQELSAVLTLAISGDEIPNAESLYRIAEPATANLSCELRPIP